MLIHQCQQPARCARASTGTMPAADTKLSSSNLLEIVCGAWESCIRQVPFWTAKSDPRQISLSQFSRAFVRYDTRQNTQSAGGSRLNIQRAFKQVNQPECDLELGAPFLQRVPEQLLGLMDSVTHGVLVELEALGRTNVATEAE